MPPSDPKREQLTAAVTARIAAIAQGESYFYTPAEVGRVWKDHVECQSGFPTYGVVEGDETRDNQSMTSGGVCLDIFDVTVWGWIKNDEAPRTVLNRAIADVIRAVFTDETWSGLAAQTLIKKIAVDEGSTMAKPFGYFEITLAIYHELTRVTV